MTTNQLVLCCAKCSMFQVQQMKKSAKWVCKVCSTKQSLTKVFAEAPASECRMLVQQLNKEFITQQESRGSHDLNCSHETAEEEQFYRLGFSSQSLAQNPTESVPFKSKWDVYL